MEDNNELKQENEGFFAKIKRRAVEIKSTATEFFTENPNAIFGIASGIGTIGLAIARIIFSAASKSGAGYSMESDISGGEFRLNHPLTNAEIQELDNRMLEGASMGDALEEMGALKKERRRRK